MKNGFDEWISNVRKSVAEIVGGRETRDMLNPGRHWARCRFSKQQMDVMPALGEVLGKTAPEFARGEIGQTPNLVDRLECRSGSDDAFHDVIMEELAGEGKFAREQLRATEPRQCQEKTQLLSPRIPYPEQSAKRVSSSNQGICGPRKSHRRQGTGESEGVTGEISGLAMLRNIVFDFTWGTMESHTAASEET